MLVSLTDCCEGFEFPCACLMSHAICWLDMWRACGSGAHEAHERTQAPLQTQLIAYTSHAIEVKEWFYWPSRGGEERAGPLSKNEIKHFFHHGKVRWYLSM